MGSFNSLTIFKVNKIILPSEIKKPPGYPQCSNLYSDEKPNKKTTTTTKITALTKMNHDV